MPDDPRELAKLAEWLRRYVCYFAGPHSESVPGREIIAADLTIAPDALDRLGRLRRDDELQRKLDRFLVIGEQIIEASGEEGWDRYRGTDIYRKGIGDLIALMEQFSEEEIATARAALGIPVGGEGKTPAGPR